MQTLRSDTREAEGLPYSVNLWGSDPQEGNDDCHTGDDFATREEAMAAFLNPWSVFNRTYYEACTAVFEIDGPDVYETRDNPEHTPSNDDGFDDDWRREIAHQAGMGLGIQAYNDEMGW